MSAPGSVKARSSVEIENSCNNCFCFTKRQHKKRTKSQEAVDVMVQAGVLKRVESPIPTNVPPISAAEQATRSPEPSLTERSQTVFKEMPSQTNLKGDPVKFPL